MGRELLQSGCRENLGMRARSSDSHPVCGLSLDCVESRPSHRGGLFRAVSFQPWRKEIEDKCLARQSTGVWNQGGSGADGLLYS
jgi:hypothetical protein